MRIGVVPYLNALPLCHYLPFKVTYGTPVKLDQMMSTAQIDMALLPTFSFFQNPSYKPYFDAGVIQSCGPVASVCLYYKKNLKKISDIKSINYSLESITSIALFKVICKYHLSFDLSLIPSVKTNADALLIIGDKALFFKEPGYHCMDLGQVWNEWQKLPFIYALWTSRIEINKEDLDKFKEARNRGVQNIQKIVQSNKDVPADILFTYLTKNIQYEMVPQSLLGLQSFQNYCFELGLLREKRTLANIHHPKD